MKQQHYVELPGLKRRWKKKYWDGFLEKPAENFGGDDGQSERRSCRATFHTN